MPRRPAPQPGQERDGGVGKGDRILVLSPDNKVHNRELKSTTGVRGADRLQRMSTISQHKAETSACLADRSVLTCGIIGYTPQALVALRPRAFFVDQPPKEISAIFPELDPEELLYSGITRYGDMIGPPSAQSLWRNVDGECLMRREVADRARELIRQTCLGLDVRIEKGHVGRDHVLGSSPPTRSPSDLMKRAGEAPRRASPNGNSPI